MPSHALDQRLFERTATVLNDVDSASPADAVQVTNGWLRVVEGNTGASSVADQLLQLRGQLQFAKPDPDRIRELLMSLADHTSQVAQGKNVQEQTAGQLEEVATALRLFVGKL